MPAEPMPFFPRNYLPSTHQPYSRPCGNAVYQTYQPTQTGMTFPQSPPPPYQHLNNDFMPQSLACFQPLASQQYLPLCPPRQRRQHFAASSTLAVARPYASGAMAMQENGWESSLDLADRPATSAGRRNDYHIATYMNRGGAICDRISATFNDVITRIDNEVFGGDETELVVRNSLPAYSAPVANYLDLPRLASEYTNTKPRRSSDPNEKGMDKEKATEKENHFKKANLYSNSRLPPQLLPFRAYMDTWRLICLAAQASQEVYNRPDRDEREDFIDADWRRGTKAMVLKTVPVDDKNTIVFAIRGSQRNFIDWAVNIRPAPRSPQGFLDDPGNNCHAGFLHVAKQMVRPVADRLRQMLEQDPGRINCSLVITGHSAGGAVASLLYMHMLAQSRECESELNVLTGCFKRVHCVTFGTPPVSLLPLSKPNDQRFRKSVFLSFVNQGDPVVRADKEYVYSLFRLYTSPAPNASRTTEAVSTLVSKASRQKLKVGNAVKHGKPLAKWAVPPATLSNAGRIVLLRETPNRHGRPGVEGCITSDNELRDVVFGDPVMHMMALYRERVDGLAVQAVTGRGLG